MNTSRAGSNMPCSRIQRRRARATSARFCSAAYRVFFEADVAASEEPPHRAAAACDPAFAHRRDDLVQRQVRWLAIRPSRNSACCSSGEMLPPLGFAATLPVPSKRCTQITTTLGLFHSVRPPRAARHRSPPLQSLEHASRRNRASASLAPKNESMPADSLIDKALGILPIRTERNLL